jgi:hypothetical protein
VTGALSGRFASAFADFRGARADFRGAPHDYYGARLFLAGEIVYPKLFSLIPKVFFVA